MTIKPIVKLTFADGSKKRLELYNRPPMIILEAKDSEGKEIKVSFLRNGPDEYRQVVEPVVESKKEVESKKIELGG